MSFCSTKSGIYVGKIPLPFYQTETSGPAFEEFLDLIGMRIALKGFEGYRAQLDNRSKY